MQSSHGLKVHKMDLRDSLRDRHEYKWETRRPLQTVILQEGFAQARKQCKLWVFGWFPNVVYVCF